MSTTTWSMPQAKAAAVRASWSLRAPIAVEQPGWRERMPCLGAPAALFFGTHPHRARAICETCPVRLSCLAAAHREEGSTHWKNLFGIRGGLTPKERWIGRQDQVLVGGSV